MGSPAFAVPSLQSLMSNRYDVAAVYTQPDKRTGRGQQMMACPVKQFAVAQGLRVIQPETFKDPAEINILKNLNPDLIVVAAYGRILPESVLQVPRYRCVNVHPSLLPKYRGPSPVAAAILNGDANTGVTIMLVEKKVDSGPILSRKEMAVSDEDTTESLTGKLAVLGAELLVDTIPGWTSGQIQPGLQDDKEATYTRMETKDDGCLDWSLSAVKLWRMTRAYHPWPGCFTVWNNNRLKITVALPLADSGTGQCGEVVLLPRTAPVRVAIRTGEGLLGLVAVQMEGKRAMTASEFIAGHKDFTGSLL